MPGDGPFTGLTVVDLTQGLAGPFCAMQLGHYGAAVIKVEPPEGDWSRTLGSTVGDRTPAYIVCNRGKRTVTANLKEADGRAVVRRLAERADVFMESNRAGVADRLGIGYEDIRAINPDVIYVSVTGFGQTGPHRDRPATDAIVQAFSGLMTRNAGDDGLPRRVDFPVVDYVTGMVAYQSVTTALFGRAMGRGGRHLDVNLMQSLAMFQQQGIANWAIDGGPHGGVMPPTGTYRTADGVMNISVVREKYFQALCRVLGLNEAAADPRFASVALRREHEDALKPLITAAVAKRATDELDTALFADEVPHARVNGYGELLADPHVAAVGAFAWMNDPAAGRVPVPNLPGSDPLAADDPRLAVARQGEHTRAVLAELGYAPADIERMAASGAVGFTAAR